MSYASLTCPPLWRRFAAMAYDGLLLVSLWGILTFAIIYPAGGALEPGQARLYLLPALIAAHAGFYGWFWRHGGQTLGMRAWRIKAVDCHGQPLTLGAIALRYALTLAGTLLALANYFWALFDREKCTLAERIGGTRTVLLPSSTKS